MYVDTISLLFLNGLKSVVYIDTVVDHRLHEDSPWKICRAYRVQCMEAEDAIGMFMDGKTCRARNPV